MKGVFIIKDQLEILQLTKNIKKYNLYQFTIVKIINKSIIYLLSAKSLLYRLLDNFRKIHGLDQCLLKH